MWEGQHLGNEEEKEHEKQEGREIHNYVLIPDLDEIKNQTKQNYPKFLQWFEMKKSGKDCVLIDQLNQQDKLLINTFTQQEIIRNSNQKKKLSKVELPCIKFTE
jgi:hypothetical protein